MSKINRFQIPCFMLEQCLAADCIGFSSYGVFLQVRVLCKDINLDVIKVNHKPDTTKGG